MTAEKNLDKKHGMAIKQRFLKLKPPVVEIRDLDTPLWNIERNMSRSKKKKNSVKRNESAKRPHNGRYEMKQI